MTKAFFVASWVSIKSFCFSILADRFLSSSSELAILHQDVDSERPSFYGLQTEQGEYCRLASVNAMGILLDRKYLQPSR